MKISIRIKWAYEWEKHSFFSQDFPYSWMQRQVPQSLLFRIWVRRKKYLHEKIKRNGYLKGFKARTFLIEFHPFKEMLKTFLHPLALGPWKKYLLMIVMAWRMHNFTQIKNSRRSVSRCQGEKRRVSQSPLIVNVLMFFSAFWALCEESFKRWWSTHCRFE